MTSHRSPPACVLVVDDDDDARSQLCGLLHSQGYIVEQAANGEDALDAVSRLQVDLVVVDLMMPGVDGAEVCAAIRRENATSSLPVILVSGRADRDSRLRAKESGVDDYLVKPVDSLELLVRAEILLKRFARMRALEAEVAQLQAEVQRLAAELRASTA